MISTVKWHLQAGQNDQPLYDKVEAIERKWGIYPRNHPIYTSPLPHEFDFDDKKDHPEYHFLLACVNEFYVYSMQFSYLFGLKQGILCLPAHDTKEITSLIRRSKEYQNFLKKTHSGITKLLKTHDNTRIDSLIQKISAFDRQSQIEIYAYLYIGYQDGNFLNQQLGEPGLKGELSILESLFSDKASALHNAGALLPTGIILDAIELKDWNKQRKVKK